MKASVETKFYGADRAPGAGAGRAYSGMQATERLQGLPANVLIKGGDSRTAGQQDRRGKERVEAGNKASWGQR